ncbi:hypothetical protein AGMMS50249_6900 [candidate division SR1 bacterium]|nr:hypothetical protein AGMMS50249_6900 [candidate division SR1 bacterium]
MGKNNPEQLKNKAKDAFIAFDVHFNQKSIVNNECLMLSDSDCQIIDIKLNYINKNKHSDIKNIKKITIKIIR